MIIGGNSSYYSDAGPIWTQSAPTLPFGFGGGGSSFGASGAFYTGQASQAPFNPYYGQSGYNPYEFVSYNPFVAPNPQANQIVYAHYAPGQAVQGQVYNAATSATPAAPAAGTPAAAATPAAPAADANKKPEAERKPAEQPKPAEEKKPEPQTVTVKRGDSLSKIAAANGTTWQKLYELNKGVVGGDPNLIRPGQVLKMP